MACLQIYQELLSLATFLRVHSNSAYFSWQNMYPNLKTTCRIKLNFFLWTKLLENALLAKYLISLVTPLNIMSCIFQNYHNTLSVNLILVVAHTGSQGSNYCKVISKNLHEPSWFNGDGLHYEEGVRCSSFQIRFVLLQFKFPQ